MKVAYAAASIFLHLLPAFAAVTLPAPSGPYKTIGTRIIPLTDYSRNDTLAPSPQPREVLVSLFYPATNIPSNQSTTDYLPTLTRELIEETYSLPNGTLAPLKTNSYLNASINPDIPSGLKTIIFSPGFGGPRLIYTIICEDLASKGYLVVAVDHPYDSIIVEFPNGKTVYSINPPPLNSSNSAYVPYYDARVLDLPFVAKSLLSLTQEVFAHEEAPCIEASKDIGIFGHSLGGAASAGAMAASDLFKSGINMDGFQFGSPFSDLHRDFLFLSSVHNDSATKASDPSWEEFEAAQSAWTRVIQMLGSVHYTYTDGPGLLAVLGLQDVVPAGEFGSIDGMRAVTLMREYVGKFFEWTVKGGKESEVLKGPVKEFPEMVFVDGKA